jgi:hypothetical protein
MSSINLVNLVDYVNQLNPEIQKEAVLKGRFVDQISQMPGIKNAEVINAIRSSLVLTAPTCGTVLSPTGSVTPFQNTLTVCELQSAEVLCVKDFESKYYGMYAKLGSYNEDVTEAFAKVYVADKMDKIQGQIEDTLICGSSTGTFSTSASTLCNGLLHTLTLTSASASVVPGGLTLSYTIANAVAIVDQLVDKVPTSIWNEPDLTLFMSYPDFRTYVRALRNENWFHFNALESEGGMVYEALHPGTNVKISATRGLNAVTNSKHYFILTNASNLFYGFDDSADYMKFQYFYSELTDAVNFRSKFKIGINAAYYDQIVLGESN